MDLNTFYLLSEGGPGSPGGGTLPRLVLNGQFFALDTGERWTAIESSEFSLYKRFLDNEDITPVLRQRAEVGFNLLRVWLLNTSVVPGGILPSQYPDFYDRLPVFASLCASYGLYIEFTAFTMARDLMPSADDQVEHLRRIDEALAGSTNVLVELVNENDQHNTDTGGNAVHLDVLEQPQHVLSSHGSNGADGEPVRPTWDYELYHTNGLFEWQRKVGHNAMEHANWSEHPCMSNENTRFIDNDDSTTHAYDAAAGGALLCAGSCYHSQRGKLSQLWDGHELECARWWVAGAKSVPLEFQAGQYHHLSHLEDHEAEYRLIRVYSRRLSDGREHIVKIYE